MFVCVLQELSHPSSLNTGARTHSCTIHPVTTMCCSRLPVLLRLSHQVAVVPLLLLLLLLQCKSSSYCVVNVSKPESPLTSLRAPLPLTPTHSHSLARTTHLLAILHLHLSTSRARGSHAPTITLTHSLTHSHFRILNHPHNVDHAQVADPILLADRQTEGQTAHTRLSRSTLTVQA